ncbi:MAG: TetR/AcrR family transcriptional regulator [Deltaproteobacteria bacterium]|nr:TetR/AcrR family transcriptional regulator [Deltaproteobacteria bacterium]
MAAVVNLTRYQQRKEKTKQDLLAAARKVLAERGYHNAKIMDIAAAADIGVGTFYLYYPTKDALFLEMVEETARLLKERIDQARLTAEGAIEKMRAANLAFFRFAEENRDLLKIIFGHGNAFNELLRTVYAMFVEDAVARVAEGVERAEFRVLQSRVIANALVGMFAQVVSWWIDQEGLSAATMADIMTDFALHGLTPKQG